MKSDLTVFDTAFEQNDSEDSAIAVFGGETVGNGSTSHGAAGKDYSPKSLLILSTISIIRATSGREFRFGLTHRATTSAILACSIFVC